MPLIPDPPSHDASTADTAPDNAPIAPSKGTQKLPLRHTVSSRTTQTWWSRLAQPMALPQATQLGLAAAGGALATVVVSLSIGWIVSREPIRDFFGRTGQETPRQLPERVALPPIAPPESAIEVRAEEPPIQLVRDEPVVVEGANEDGTALAALEPLTDDDRRRIEKRREDDRVLREKRALEDQKRAIERQLEDKQVEEKRRGEDSQLSEGRHDEDKKRIEDRLEEDRRLLDERDRKEREAVATAQRADNTQFADAQP